MTTPILHLNISSYHIWPVGGSTAAKISDPPKQHKMAFKIIFKQMYYILYYICFLVINILIVLKLELVCTNYVQTDAQELPRVSNK